jgi:hypothetical protein
MTNRRSETLTEADKQTQPMPGEVDPKDARQKAAMFAAIERRRSGSVKSSPPAKKK